MRGALRFAASTNITRWKRIAAPTIGAYGIGSAAPTKPTTVVNDELFWRRVGSYMQLRYHFEATDATGAASGTGPYSLTIPTGETLDSNIITAPGEFGGVDTKRDSVVGYCVCEGDTLAGLVGVGNGKVYMIDATRFGWAAGWGTAGVAVHVREVGSTRFPINLVPVRYQLLAFIPISGWSEVK